MTDETRSPIDEEPNSCVLHAVRALLVGYNDKAISDTFRYLRWKIEGNVPYDVGYTVEVTLKALEYLGVEFRELTPDEFYVDEKLPTLRMIRRRFYTGSWFIGIRIRNQFHGHAIALREGIIIDTTYSDFSFHDYVKTMIEIK